MSKILRSHNLVPFRENELPMFIFVFQKFRLATYFVELLPDGTQERFQTLHSVVYDPNLRQSIEVFLNTQQTSEKIGKKRK